MSHSTVLIIGPDPEEQLKPFDENLEVPRYVKQTKAEIITKGRKDIEEYATTGYYAEYLKDPTAYEAKVTSRGHIDYLKNEFPKRLKWTDEEIYQDAIEYVEKEDIGPDGETYSTYNPNSKWDWYSLGGRWAGFFKLKQGAEGVQGHHRAKDFAAISGEEIDDLPVNVVDQAYKRDIDFEGMRADAIQKAEETWAEYEAQLAKGKKVDPYWEFGIKPDQTKEDFLKSRGSISTFAVLKDGQWYERGEMGWWGITINEKSTDEWEAQFEELLNELPEDTLLSLYDVHI